VFEEISIEIVQPDVVSSESTTLIKTERVLMQFADLWHHL